MEITQLALDEAKSLILAGTALPQELASAPLFFLAHADDTSIQAFAAIDVDGAIYKIGISREVVVQ